MCVCLSCSEYLCLSLHVHNMYSISWYMYILMQPPAFPLPSFLRLRLPLTRGRRRRGCGLHCPVATPSQLSQPLWSPPLSGRPQSIPRHGVWPQQEGSGEQQTHSLPSSFKGQGAEILVNAHHHCDDSEVKKKPRYERSCSVQLVASELKPPRFAMDALPGHSDDVITIPVRSSQVG